MVKAILVNHGSRRGAFNELMTEIARQLSEDLGIRVEVGYDEYADPNWRELLAKSQEDVNSYPGLPRAWEPRIQRYLALYNPIDKALLREALALVVRWRGPSAPVGIVKDAHRPGERTLSN